MFDYRRRPSIARACARRVTRERANAPKRGRYSTISFLHQLHLCSGSLMI